MALLRREVAAFAVLAGAVAVGLVLAVRGCGDSNSPAVETTQPRATTRETTATAAGPEAVVAEHVERRRPDLVGARVLLSQDVNGLFGVVALRRGRSVGAFVLRRSGDTWRVVTSGPVRLRALRPDPGERVVRRTQLAAEILADSRIEEAGLWMDGLAVPTNGAGPSPRRLTMYTEAPQPLRSGVHVVVAFASTAADAAALAWVFEVA